MKIVVTPQLSVNDQSAVVVEWGKEDGQFVKKGEIVGSLETSKSVVEVEAEEDGYFRPVARAGDRVPVGGALFVLTDAPADPLEPILAAVKTDRAAPAEGPGDERRWTKKAELLAARHGIDIADIPAVGVVREADVEQYVRSKKAHGPTDDLIDGVYAANRAERILLIGGGRGAVQVLDVVWRMGSQRPVGIVDDNPAATGKRIMGVEVLGTTDLVPKLREDGVFDRLVIAFSNVLDARARLFEEMSGRGMEFANVIDPSVRIHSNVSMGTGNVIIANCRIGACAQLGDNNFLSAYVNLEHHNVLGSHCTFGPGVMTSSRVRIGNRVRFGTGIFIEPGVSVGDESIVASGAVIASHVPARTIVKTRVETLIRPR